MEKTHTKHRQPLWIQQFYGLPKDRKEAEARPVTIVADILAALNGEEATKEETVTAPATETVKAQPARTKVRSWMAECNDPREIDCSMDLVTEWLLPNGKTVIERTHCH